MFMESADRKNLITDIIKNSSILLFVALVTKSKFERGSVIPLDKATINSIVITLLAFVFYHMVIVNLIKPLKLI